MANNRHELINRFLMVSDVCYVQPDIDTPLDPANINWRHKADISWEEVVLRRPSRDCKNQDLINEKISTRGLRMTLSYPEVTDEIMAFWGALYLGAAAAPTGTPQNETQTLSRTGTVSGGGFKVRADMEGMQVTSAVIPYDATNQEIIDALTHSRMLWIQPGDISLTGTWGTAIVIEFIGRLEKANIPTLTIVDSTVTGGGSVGIAATQNGANKYHLFTRSASSQKQYFSFVLGWDDVADRVEQYAGYAVEQFNPSVNADENAALQVVIVGPWQPAAILEDFDIVPCENIEPIPSEDCKVIIDSNWETTDINNHSWSLNDNVPTDKASAHGFASVDITRLRRGNQPSYEATNGIFGDEESNIYDLAVNERTQDPVPHITHFGMPGHRFSVVAENAKIKFGANRLTYAGTLNESVVNTTSTAYRQTDGDPPVYFEAYMDQTAQLLQLEP